MTDSPRRPFWEKLKETFSSLTEESAPAPEPPRPPKPPQAAKKAISQRLRPTLRPRPQTPGVEEDTLIKGGLRLRRGRYATCPLPPVDYQTGDLVDPPPEPGGPSRPALVDPLTLEDITEAGRSPHRLALIDAFAAGHRPLPQMNDPQYMYRVITDERDYQTAALKACRREYVMARGEGSDDVYELEAQLKRHGATIQHLFKVLKQITGKDETPTGGTGFI